MFLASFTYNFFLTLLVEKKEQELLEIASTTQQQRSGDLERETSNQDQCNTSNQPEEYVESSDHEP